MEIPQIEGYECPPRRELGLRASPPCQFCGGLGWRYRIETIPGYTKKVRVRCDPCGGKGTVDKGSVRRQIEGQLIQVRLTAAGLRDVQRIMYEHEGAQTPRKR